MTRLALARAIFDLEPMAGEAVPCGAATARTIDAWLGPGEIALVTGPSGAGKSTILRHVRGVLRERGHAAVGVDPSRLDPRALVVDAVRAPLGATLALLAACGLADATILERRIGEVSTGERWRLALAVALRRAQRRGPHATLLVDELGSMLDRVTARCVCRTLRRWVVPRAIRAVCAAQDEALMEVLAPAVLAVQPLRAAATVRRSARAGVASRTEPMP